MWFRENIREPLSIRARESSRSVADLTRVVEATLIFRWFNRISTGQYIKDLLLNGWNTEEARDRLTGVTPIVTGAYIIKAGDGMSKLEGILQCIDLARPKLPSMVNAWEFAGGASLEGAWMDLKSLHYMGGFMAYEVVTDLRWTPVLEKAPDIMTWGNLGPGAIRGMSWVVHNNPYAFANSGKMQREMLKMMADLLELSKLEEFWPQSWPHWEMHEVEMWLCEHAKYMAAYNGVPQKRRYQS